MTPVYQTATSADCCKASLLRNYKEGVKRQYIHFSFQSLQRLMASFSNWNLRIGDQIPVPFFHFESCSSGNNNDNNITTITLVSTDIVLDIVLYLLLPVMIIIKIIYPVVRPSSWFQQRPSLFLKCNAQFSGPVDSGCGAHPEVGGGGKGGRGWVWMWTCKQSQWSPINLRNLSPSNGWKCIRNFENVMFL